MQDFLIKVAANIIVLTFFRKAFPEMNFGLFLVIGLIITFVMSNFIQKKILDKKVEK